MDSQGPFAIELLLTQVALVQQLCDVCLQMFCQVWLSFAFVCAAGHRASKLALIKVSGSVALNLILCPGPEATHVTEVWFLVCVCFHVSSYSVRMFEGHFTQVARIRPLDTVCKHMLISISRPF